MSKKTRKSTAPASTRMTVKPLPEPLGRHTVSGFVRTTESMPVSGVKVAAFHYAIPRKIKLGQAITGKDGAYSIDYTNVKKNKLANASVDLMAECLYDDKTGPAKSELMVAAPANAYVSFTLPREANRAPSEFEKIEKGIASVMDPAKTAKLSGEDIAFLSKKLEIDGNLLKRAVRAYAFAAQAEKTGVRIEASVFYSLDDGNEEKLSTLETISSLAGSEIALKIGKAAESGVIPFHLGEKREAVAGAVKEIAVKLALADTGDKDDFSINGLLGLYKGLSKEKREKLVKKYVLHDNGETGFPEQLKSDGAFKDDYATVRDLFEIARITENNLSLLWQLYPSLEKITDPAAWDRKQWLKALSHAGIIFPIDRKTGKPFKKQDYADYLSNKFQKRFPIVSPS